MEIETKLGGGESWLNPKFIINKSPIELVEASEHETTKEFELELEERSVERSDKDKEQ